MPATPKINRPNSYGAGCVFAAHLQDLAGIASESWTINGAPTIEETPYGKGIELDGASDSIDCLDSPVYQFGTGDFSAEMLIRVDDYADFYTPVSKRTDGSTGWRLYLAQTAGNIVAQTHDGTLAQIAVGTVIGFGWHHIVFTRSGASGVVYIDNTATAGTTRAGDLSAAGTSLFIGAYNAIQEYKGNIALVALYNYEMTAGDVTARYNSIIGADPKT